MYSREKEFIRQAFMDGALDVGCGFETIKAFVEIMAGEMEALIAIEHAGWLEEGQTMELLQLAAPSEESLRERRAWINSIRTPKRRQATTNGGPDAE